MEKDTFEYAQPENFMSVEFIKKESGFIVKMKVKGVMTTSIRLPENKFQELLEFLEEYKMIEVKEIKETSKKMSKKEVKDIKDHFNMAEGLYI